MTIRTKKYTQERDDSLTIGGAKNSYPSHTDFFTRCNEADAKVNAAGINPISVPKEIIGDNAMSGTAMGVCAWNTDGNGFKFGDGDTNANVAYCVTPNIAANTDILLIVVASYKTTASYITYGDSVAGVRTTRSKVRTTIVGNDNFDFDVSAPLNTPIAVWCYGEAAADATISAGWADADGNTGTATPGTIGGALTKTISDYIQYIDTELYSMYFTTYADAMGPGPAVAAAAAQYHVKQHVSKEALADPSKRTVYHGII